jgi:hypothetical protein
VREERKEDIMFGDNKNKNKNNNDGNNNNNTNIPRPQFMQSEPRFSTTEAYTDDDYAMRSSSAASPMSPYCYDPGRSLLFHFLLFIL